MAKKSASEKTNVMRVLEQHRIAYTPHEYPHGKEAVDGASVAHLLGQDPAQVFKTLVARGKSGGCSSSRSRRSLTSKKPPKPPAKSRSRWSTSRSCSA